MEKKKIAVIFAVSWALLAIFGVLLINEIGRTAPLKKSIQLLKKNIDLLKADVRQYKEIADQKAKEVDSTIDYLEWQFVLKDQALQLNNKIRNNIAKAELKDNPYLLNLLYYNLGLSNTMALEFDAAIDAFEQAVRYNPEDADSYYNLGLLYSTYRQDKVARAVANYNKFLEFAPPGAKAAEVKDRLNQLTGKK